MKVKKSTKAQMDYGEALLTDINDLEQGWLDQPGYYMYYAELHVEAITERDRLKENLLIIDDEIIQQIIIEEGKKPPDSVLTGMIAVDNKHMEAFGELLDANKQVNLMAAAKSAFEHRKKQLESLVTLFVSGYFSEPKINKEVKREPASARRREHENVLGKSKRLQKKKKGGS